MPQSRSLVRGDRDPEPSRSEQTRAGFDDWRRIADQNERLVGLLHDIGDTTGLLLLVKREGGLEFELWSRAMEQFTGIGRDTLVGCTGDGVFPAEHMNAYKARDREALATGHVVSAEEPIVVRGTTKWIYTQKLAITTGGRERYVLGILADVTERRRADSERQGLFDAMVEGIAQRDRLLAGVAHDLANPIAAAALSAQTLLARPLDDTARRYARRIVSAAQHMTELIGDLRNEALLREGKLALALAPHAVEVLLGEVAELLVPAADAAGVQLIIATAESIPPVLCDRHQVCRVLCNLVGNAIKFTPAGGEIAVVAEPTAGAVQFSISDTGRGIAAPDLARVFEPYWQAEGSRGRGMGLGLAVAKGIVEAHGGMISVDSILGQGATFCFTIPVAA